MTGIRVGRLRKLAKHLRGEHHAHKRFNFRMLAEGKLSRKGNYCGSVGCAIGEFPAIWPEEWRWGRQGQQVSGTMFEIVHKSQEGWETDYKLIAEFFSITRDQTDHLFDPEEQDMENFGGKWLGGGASAIDVADNINAFIEKVAS